MDNLDTKPDFGIENTLDTAGTGDSNLLNNLFAESALADPDKVIPIKDDDGKGPDGKADPTKLAGKDDDIPDNIAEDPNALTNFLLGEEQ